MCCCCLFLLESVRETSAGEWSSAQEAIKRECCLGKQVQRSFAGGAEVLGCLVEVGVSPSEEREGVILFVYLLRE